ncbi:hypothetical protein [Streptomyces sp. TP-A0874]|uniref:hypothetical protein n=1 Tax=Streptomyces sp. TP-A0874 TaxID=549819 RepID=UPI000853C356|nr:hypothetical protein [Streptomyces sp. TP-A0874]
MIGREDGPGPGRGGQPGAPLRPRERHADNHPEGFNRQVGLASLLFSSLLAVVFAGLLVFSACTEHFTWGRLAVALMATGGGAAAWYGWRRESASASWCGLFLAVTSTALAQSLL